VPHMPRGGVPILPFARKDVHLSDTHVVFNDDPLRYMASVEQQMNLTHSAGFSFVSACAGTDADGRRLALIFQEYPEPVRFRRQKAVAEEHHVDRFIADYRHAVGSDPFEHVTFSIDRAWESRTVSTFLSASRRCRLG
jgi:hypothetical protein